MLAINQRCHEYQPAKRILERKLALYKAWRSLLPYYFTGCSPRDHWHLPAADANFLSDVTLLNDSVQYPSCDDRSIGSVVLVNTTLNTATVAYYTGTTAGSSACFVCDEGSGYELNKTTAERTCQTEGIWSGSPITCGMLVHLLYL